MRHAITFYTPDYDGAPQGFGCATFGMAGVCGHDGNRSRRFSMEPESLCFCGTYDQVLQEIRDAQISDPKAAMVLFGNAGGENQMIRQLKALLGCPLVGGGAAMNPATGAGGLLAGGGQVNVLVITDPDLQVETSHCCIHDRILGTHRLTTDGARTLLAVDGEDAKTFLDRQKQALGLPETDFEHLTFSDLRGVNAHLSLEDGQICSGRDLEEEMILRYVAPEDAYEAVSRFYRDENAIIFGCAGLRGILDRDVSTDAMGLYLFGEVCDLGDQAEFGNLMLSKLRFRDLRAH